MHQPSGRPLLSVKQLWAGYGRVGVLENVSLEVPPATIVAVVGSNGAGKTTLLKTISGLLHTMKGDVEFDGERIANKAPERIVALGLLHVAEGRRLFRTQTVLDNLQLGIYGAGLDRAEEKRRYDEVFGLFPILSEKKESLAASLSGGQQQMLAVAQALMRAPKLLMLDEPSLGLAPVVVDQVFDVVLKLRRDARAVILVEQLVDRALEIADFAYVMQNGRMVGNGTGAALQGSGVVRRAYLGQ